MPQDEDEQLVAAMTAIGEEPEAIVPGVTHDVKIVQRTKVGRKGRMHAAREVLVPKAAAVPTEPAPPPVGVAAAPKPRAAAPPPAAVQEPLTPTSEPTKTAVARWPLVLERLAQEGRNASHVTIRVYRTALGHFAGQSVPIMLGPLEGANVEGNEQMAPSDALTEAVTQVYHMARKGPAKYNLEFHYKVAPREARGGTMICAGDLTLDDPDAIAAQERRTQEYFAKQSAPREMPFSYARGTSGVVEKSPGVWGPLRIEPQSNSQIDDLRRDLAKLIGGQNATEEVRTIITQALAGAMPPPAAVTPPVPQLSEQEREWIEEGRFRAMAARLGYVPRAENVGVGAMPPAAAAMPHQPPTQVVSQAVGDPLAGVQGLLRSLEALEGLKPRFAKLAGVAMPELAADGDEGPPEPVVPDDPNPFGLQEVPVTRFQGNPIMIPTKADGFVETVQAFAMANPNLAMEMLTRVAGVLNSGAFGALIEKLTNLGGPPAQVARQVAARGVTGTGSEPQLNGAAHAALASTVTPPPAVTEPAPFRGPSA